MAAMNDLHCPNCTNLVLRYLLWRGRVEIVCRHCKALITLESDEAPREGRLTVRERVS